MTDKHVAIFDLKWEPFAPQGETVAWAKRRLGKDFPNFVAERLQYTCPACEKRHTLIFASFCAEQRTGILSYKFGLIEWDDLIMGIGSMTDLKTEARATYLEHTGIDIAEAAEYVPPKGEQH
jgi:hypothetical protein